MGAKITWIRDPRPGENSWQLYKAAWPRMEWRTRARLFLIRLPEIFLAWLRLEHLYWQSQSKLGFATWYAPHNLYRQAWHLAGGLSIAATLGIIGFIWLSLPLTLAFTLLKERSDAKKTGFGSKNILDAASWVAGASLGVLKWH